MKNIKLTFRQQLTAGLGLLIVCGIIGMIFKTGIFFNIAWIVYGLAFIINPVWPQSSGNADPVKMKRGCRIAGVLCVLVGLIARFGMSV